MSAPKADGIAGPVSVGELPGRTEKRIASDPMNPKNFGVSPRMRVDLLVNDFTYKAVNDRAVVIFAGRSKRTFRHIRDAIRATGPAIR